MALTPKIAALTTLALIMSSITATQGVAATGNWDHKANIQDAAVRLAKLHRSAGSGAVLKFLEACYRTHLLASDYSQGLEACLAQDYMHSRVLAAIYAKVPQDDRARAGAPSPEQIAQGMSDRFAVAFAQYKISNADADDFKRLVDKVGVPVFLKTVFPPRDKQK